jgi:outer membrane protein OmpA-like peptidoglycan-associated protein
MRTFILGFLVWGIFTIFARWYFICEIRNHCGEAEPPPISRDMTLNLMDGDTAILEGYEQFEFDSNSISANMTENNQAFIKAVAKYLKENPDKNVTLKGRFLASEKDAPSSFYENIGIARAAFIEELLLKEGIENDRITIDYEMVEGDKIEEPISFSLYIPEAPDEFAKLQFRFEDMTFSDANFEFGKAIFKPGPQFVYYADSVYTALSENENLQLLIIGHTDSIGSDESNLKLGAERAVSAMEYFNELGIAKERISTESKGEMEPVEYNAKPDGSDNPEGRQKNRRVNFVIQPVGEGEEDS